MSRRLDNDTIHQSSSSSSPSPSRSLSNEISSVHKTLHLLYHHNKNQHRCTKWWKWLNILRRWSLKLACEAEKVEMDEDFDETEKASANMLKIMNYLRNEVIQRCHGAFSTVVAEAPFSPLGVVLLATLARLAKIVNANFPEEHDVQQLVETDVKAVELSGTTTSREDLGERINRSDVMTARPKEKMEVGMGVSVDTTVKKTKRALEKEEKEERGVMDAPKKAKRQRVEQEKKIKKKTKKRKGNAIDDIFGDLF